MSAYALEVEYDGTGFVGWQRQANGLSVQQVLEEAAARLAGGAAVASIVAGRTDAGVHAAAQVARIDLPRALPPERLRDALNFHMKPHPVAVLRAAVAAEGWNPRFSAIGRRYRFTILNRRARPALLLHRAWHVPQPLDAGAMHEAARVLLGRHDFSTFRAAACQARSPVKTLDGLEVSRAGELIHIDAAARSFLHHQVRNMAGTLKLVGEGSWDAGRLAAALAAADRRAGGPTAPPEGLCLTAVVYPADPFAD